MAELVNLKRVRKQRAKVARDKQAAANRVKFGQRPPTATERASALARDAALDGKKLDPT